MFLFFFFSRCTLPQKPATVTEKRSNLAIYAFFSEGAQISGKRPKFRGGIIGSIEIIVRPMQTHSGQLSRTDQGLGCSAWFRRETTRTGALGAPFCHPRLKWKFHIVVGVGRDGRQHRTNMQGDQHARRGARARRTTETHMHVHVLYRTGLSNFNWAGNSETSLVTMIMM